MTNILKTITANGQKVEIRVDRDGEFHARVNGESFSVNTLTALEAQIRTATKKAKIVVAVPVSVLGYQWKKETYSQNHWVCGYGVRHVTLTGKGIDGDVRYRDDRVPNDVGELSRIGGAWRHNQVVRRLTDGECAEYERLSRAKDAAASALDTFEQLRKIDPDDLVQAAINAKIDTPVEPSDESEDPR